MRTDARIVNYEKVKKELAQIKKKKTVLVGGCFDLIHFGHVQFLKKAREQGDYLIVALESDAFIKKTKRKSPIHSQEERAKVLSSLNFVGAVVNLPFFSTDEQYLEMVKLIRPKIIAVTRGDSQLKNKKRQAAMIGAKVKIVTPLIRKYSTRKILDY